MAVRTREEIMTQLQSMIGEDDTSDETLAFIQDVSDTLGNDNSAQRITELETQLEEQDKTWRKKYRDAFFTVKGDDSFEDEPEETKPRRFEDLFTIQKKG